MLSAKDQPSRITDPLDLHEVDWIPVPNCSYLLKYVFSDCQYIIVVSDLTSVFEEKLIATDIEARFIKFNSHVKMKPHVILEHLKKSLEETLVGESRLDLKLEKNKITISLDFHVCLVACKYDIELILMPGEKVMQYIIVPTVLGSLLSQRKVLELQTNSEKKTKPPIASNAFSQLNAIDPEFIKGKNVPFQFLCNSFMSIQGHFKELYAENKEAYISPRKTKQDKESKAPSVIHHKKIKLTENTKDESNLKFEEEGPNISKEEESATTALSESTKVSTKLKKEKKFLKI